MAKIMVVDDEMEICKVLQSFLQSRGYDAIYATSGEEALALAKEQRPDLVLLDIRMPGMDGVQLLRLLKEVDPEIKVIMVTGVMDEEVGKDLLRHGASDYITKPIDFRYLETSVLTNLL